MKTLSDFYKIHEGETIYLIGTGCELLSIPAEYKEKIKKGISIGVNASHLFMDTTYHCSAHWSMFLLHCEFSDVSEYRFFQGYRPCSKFRAGKHWDSILGVYTVTPPTISHSPKTLDMSFYKENKTVDISSNIRLLYIDEGQTKALFDKPDTNPAIFGMDNIAFTATNLACLMGASKIVYIGFDQKNSEHFYEWHPYRPVMQKQLQEIEEKYKQDKFLEEDISTLKKFVKKEMDPDFLRFKLHFTEKFKAMFSTMHKHNVKPVVHNKRSIIFDAGGHFEEYDCKVNVSE